MGRLFAYYILFSMLIYDSKNHLDRFNLFKSTPAEHEIRVTILPPNPFLNSLSIFYALMISQNLLKIVQKFGKVVQKMAIFPHFMQGLLI